VWLRDDVLAPAPRLASRWRVGRATAGDPGPAPGGRQARLVSRRDRRLVGPREKGGGKTGKNPTDRGKRGSKRHLVTDRQGIPLAQVLTAANVNEGTVAEQVIDAVPPVRGKVGRPRRRPDKLHGDKGYDAKRVREALRARGIIPRIARRGIESSTKLGRHRWVGERSFAWLGQMRRLLIRYERRPEIYEAFLTLGCALIAFRYLLPL
jgi:transposase